MKRSIALFFLVINHTVFTKSNQNHVEVVEADRSVFSNHSQLDDDEATVEVEASSYAYPRQCEEFCESETATENETARKKKSLDGSPIARNSLVVDAMLKTPMLQIHQTDPDILSILRDRYDLPKGKKEYIDFLKINFYIYYESDIL